MCKVTHGLKGFLFLFQLGVGLGELFLDLVQFVLNLLDLLLQGTDFFLSLGEKEGTVRLAVAGTARLSAPSQL